MRALLQPKVLKQAALAALISAVFCYPRLATATSRKYPVWYLEAVLLLGGTMLWGFVFAWHTNYARRPLIAMRPGPGPLVLATATGLAVAAMLHMFVDPALRSRTPEDYPGTLAQWLAMTLFSLAFTQLLLVFAPFAWLVRLFKRVWSAGVLTVLFGVFVLLVKHQASPSPVEPPLFVALLAVRIVAGSLCVLLLLRGGVLLVWWWVLLIQSRHLLTLGS